jgi:hypothetical protein
VRPRRSHGVATVAGLAAGAITGCGLVLQLLGREYGSTAAERAIALPGDELVPDPTLVTNHAITVDVEPAALWPWLTQMGWHRGGWYTPRWIDRLLFPDNWPSVESLEAALVCDLQPGDVIPDGPDGTAWFVVRRADPPYLLVLHSTTHLPRGWSERFGAQLSWSWMFRLEPIPPHQTRLLVRSRGRASPAWLDLAYRSFVIPADGFMATGMLRGLRRRVEVNTARQDGTKDPAERSLPFGGWN